MSRLIDVDDLVPDICDAEIEYGTKPMHFSANAIDLAPTVDAVSVVRCCQCRYERPEVDAYTQETIGYWCSLHDIGSIQDSDFCSYGERKEGAD